VSDFIVRWLTSFLCERQQRLKVFNALSDWVTLRGGMLPGSWLEPRIFVLLVNNLRPRLLTHKYLDDTTMTEIKVKVKVKEADLYSAFFEVPYTQGAQVRITQCYLQTTPYLPLPGERCGFTKQYAVDDLIEWSELI